MIPIMLLAFLSLTLIIERLIYFSRTKAWLKSRLFETLAQFKKQSDARYREEMEDDLSQKIHAYIQRMERGVPLINGIGNIAPILGFFGTVVGMIRAFAAIAAATTVNAKVVAVGIQIALVTTAGGLAVAVPSLFFYHFFMHIIHKSYAQADVWIQEEIRELPRLSSEAE
jgi:biopolymer transport protein ExbB